jgi:hypothetical protein
MRILFCLLLLSMAQHSAHAAPSRVWWPQWTISSSEELWDEVGRKYSSYPIPLMLDGDAKTAWVHSTKSKQYDKSVFASRYGFVFNPSTPATVDALRMMNGQNLSRARFLANHRVTKIRVTQELPDAKRVVTTAKLLDAMGWHTVKLPRHKIKSLKVEILELKKSSAKNADVCISELELRDKSKKIDWRLPLAVMFWDGIEGCGTSLLISRHGKVLDGIATDIGYDDEWNSTGRYVTGYNGGKDYVWIADVWRGEVVRKISYAPKDGSADNVNAIYHWQSAQILTIEERRENQKTRYRFLKAPNFK